MYFEPFISVKCCPILHIKQLRNNLHYIYCRPTVRSGWVGEGGHRRKGGSRKRGAQDPLTPPPLWICLCTRGNFHSPSIQLPVCLEIFAYDIYLFSLVLSQDPLEQRGQHNRSPMYTSIVAADKPQLLLKFINYQRASINTILSQRT